jgi:hypothetical protein
MNLPDVELTTHAKAMLKERHILEEWVWRTIGSPDQTKRYSDGNMHYTRTIDERAGHILRVVVNTDARPNRVVTVFFDRRLRKREI